MLLCTSPAIAVDRLEGGTDNILQAAPHVIYESTDTKADMGMQVSNESVAKRPTSD